MITPPALGLGRCLEWPSRSTRSGKPRRSGAQASTRLTLYAGLGTALGPPQRRGGDMVDEARRTWPNRQISNEDRGMAEFCVILASKRRDPISRVSRGRSHQASWVSTMQTSPSGEQRQRHQRHPMARLSDVNATHASTVASRPAPGDGLIARERADGLFKALIDAGLSLPEDWHRYARRLPSSSAANMHQESCAPGRSDFFSFPTSAVRQDGASLARPT